MGNTRVDDKMFENHRFLKIVSIALVLLQLVGCNAGKAPQTVQDGLFKTSAPLPTTINSSPEPAQSTPVLSLSELQDKTLSSLQKVDEYPLYTMVYYEEYRHRAFSPSNRREVASEMSSSSEFGWGCSLFTSLGDYQNKLYGRNFDWDQSPALLLFTDEPGALASVSMVDIAYLGFDGNRGDMLLDLPLSELETLLDAPFLPFDGMNDAGLAIGMAAVPAGNMPVDPEKETIGSLGVIREILDFAKDVDDALEIMRGYNIDMTGGPPLHYLIADKFGDAVLVEFYEGKMIVIPNETSWHQATNFLRSAVGASTKGICWRYDILTERLQEMDGWATVEDAFDLLDSVSQLSTQWSVVYEMDRYQVHVVMGSQYDRVHSFDAKIPSE